MKLGSRDYLIQQNWVNANGGSCALAWSVTPDFSVSLSPSSATVPAAGGVASYTMTVTPLNGFNGTVTYGSVSGAPAGATVTTGANGSFSITTFSNTTPGTYTITETATYGSLNHTASATLIVSPPPVPSFNLGISSSSQVINRPGSAPFTVTVSPVNGFKADVTLAVSGLKTGLAGVFNVNPIPGDGSSTLTISATNSAKKGNNSFTVTATSGSVVKTISGSVRVQ
jgi:hypothetical protein